MKRVGFIINGRNRKKTSFYKGVKRFKSKLKDTEYTIVETSEKGNGIALAKEFANEGYTHIIAIGGDGTLNEVLNGILLSDNRGCCLGLLPLGSANDFCKTVPVSPDIPSLFEDLDSNNQQSIDIGLIKYTSENQKPSRRYFINIADLGIGAEVVKRVNNSPRVLGPNILFTKSIVQTFLTYKNQHITCQTDDWEYSGKTNSLVIANARYFGNGMCIAPNAKPDDGQFEVVIMGDISIKDYLKNVKDVKKGRIIKHPQLQYKTATKLHINGIDEPCGIECDGEFLGFTPVEIELLPLHIQVLNKKGH